jgi:proteasome lid subunit RPN8/RPN11
MPKKPPIEDGANTSERFYIRKAALELILGASRSLHPREFIGFLRAEGNKITEVIVAPGMTYGIRYASYSEYMLPPDKSIVGSVHSHPSAINQPSQNDLIVFGRKGNVHLIAGYPYQSINDIASYDREGNPISLEEAP